MFDLIIKSGDVIDGTKRVRFRADVGVVGDRIVEISAIDAALGRRVIDATGKIVSPGFIDVHTHADGWLLKTPNFVSKTTQGFTTEIIMADGISYAPVNKHTVHEWLYYMRTINGLQFADYEGWESVGDFLNLLDHRSAQNVATHVPYANVRTLACGFGRQSPDDTQMALISAEITQSMEAGAVGLSTGLDYIVQCHADSTELTEACRAIAPYQGLYVTHIRYKKGILAGLQEAVMIAKNAGVPLHVSHLKGGAQGQASVDEQLLHYIDTVACNEVDFSFDVYPYQPTSTMLHSLFPYEIWDAGPFGVAQRLRDPVMQTRAAANLRALDLANTFIAWLPSKANSRYQGQSLQAYCEAINLPPIEAFVNLLIEENLAVLLVFRLGDDALINPYLTHPKFMLGSDGIFQTDGIVHPRQFGSATRIIGRCVRDLNLFSLEEAIHKMTAFPAARFGLKQRGVLATGNFADITIFDPETVQDNATYDNPQQLSLGIDAVLVNGTPIVVAGVPVSEFDGLPPGRALRFNGAG